VTIRTQADTQLVIKPLIGNKTGSTMNVEIFFTSFYYLNSINLSSINIFEMSQITLIKFFLNFLLHFLNIFSYHFLSFKNI